MGSGNVFQRYEYKYQITQAQKEILLDAMEGRMIPDAFGKSSIRNLYLDTDDYRLIRTSLEQPLYKEKLRIRSYGPAGKDSTVFLELKKKYDSIVYKRRVGMSLPDAMACTAGPAPLPDTQIGREIQFAMDFYGSLHPTAYLSYDREAFFDAGGSGFRVTFDDNIRCRRDRLRLTEEPSGSLLLPKGTVLMELKIQEAMPLWMARLLSENGICKTTFSKYGAAYLAWMQEQMKGNQKYA